MNGTDAPSAAFLSHRKRSAFSLGKSAPKFFPSPAPAGRRITAGFSYLQRLGKSGAVDVWFPDELREKVDGLLKKRSLAAGDFPAEWAAIRQFELLQEPGNYKIYDMDPAYLMRTLYDLTRNMKGGGYRVTVATIGSYGSAGARDELEILDRSLQDRISLLINMLYLEEQSEKLNVKTARTLADGKWNYLTALPHIGVALGARALFRPPPPGAALSPVERRHRLARHFFDILGLLPQNHILHDTALGLQLPESINEQEWIYISPEGEKASDFVQFMDSIFRPHDRVSMSMLDGREGAKVEIMPTVTHMRGAGDRLRADEARFYRDLARYAAG